VNQMTKEPNNRKKTSFIQWLLLIIIPLVLAISILFITLSLLGMEPVNKIKAFANQIPVVNQWVTTEEEEEIERIEAKYQNQIDELENENSRLEGDLAAKQSEVEQLEQELVRLNFQIEELILESSNEVNQEEMISKMIDTYDEMSPTNAAAIISNMNQANSILILQDIEETQRAAILSAMDPEIAAQLTEQLLN